MNAVLPPEVGSRATLRIGDRVLDFGREELRYPDGTPIELRPQAFRVLRYLAAHPGRLVTKEELLEQVWTGLVVTDDSLVQAIGDIRRALDDTGHRIVKTVPRRGYVLVAGSVREAETLVRQLEEPDETNSANVAGESTAQPETKDRSPTKPIVPLVIGLVIVAGIAVAVLLLRRAPGASQQAALPPTMPDRPSIAVLAFKGEGDTPGSKELAHGLAADIVYELARNADLRVVSNHSSFALDGMGLTSAQIGERLRTRYFVDGSAQQVGDKLLLRVQLVDAPDGRIVWSARHEAGAADVLRVRDALAHRIAGSVHTSMRQSEEAGVMQRPPASLDVYTMVLRAIALKHQFRADATREARRLLNEVLQRDPQYAPAWLYLSMLNGIDAANQITGELTYADAPGFIAQAERAIALDPKLPAAYFALSIAYQAARRPRDALQAAQRCVELGPSDADCLGQLARTRALNGDVARALTAIEAARDLSPVQPPWITAWYAHILWDARRYDEALRQADECLQERPMYRGCRRARLQVLAETGRLDEARAEAAHFVNQAPRETTEWFVEMYAPEAVELRTRARAAARAAGIPERQTSEP
jgi:TolB-like protein/DNA-binding winged helix-turn-helix (wHTH) protein